MEELDHIEAIAHLITIMDADDASVDHVANEHPFGDCCMAFTLAWMKAKNEARAWLSEVLDAPL